MTRGPETYSPYSAVSETEKFIAPTPPLLIRVDDQLQFVDALKVGVLGGIAGLDQHLETALHQIDDAAAQDGLLTKQVGLGLVMEGSLHNAGAGAADTGDVSQGDLQSVAVAFCSTATGRAHPCRPHTESGRCGRDPWGQP